MIALPLGPRLAAREDAAQLCAATATRFRRARRARLVMRTRSVRTGIAVSRLLTNSVAGLPGAWRPSRCCLSGMFVAFSGGGRCDRRRYLEAFVTHFADAFYRHKKDRLTAEEARELLGLSGRHFRRLRGRYEEVGLEDLWDLRGRRRPASELERMRGLDREE